AFCRCVPHGLSDSEDGPRCMIAKREQPSARPSYGGRSVQSPATLHNDRCFGPPKRGIACGTKMGKSLQLYREGLTCGEYGGQRTKPYMLFVTARTQSQLHDYTL